jgi:hypothetical protein
MINFDPLRPYLWLIKAGAALLLASTLVFGGCQWQGSRDRERISKLEDGIAERNTALKAAAASLQGAGDAIRTVNAQAEANVLAAMEQARRGSDAAAAARRDAKKTADRVASLERELEREKTTCTEGRARICGVPLR